MDIYFESLLPGIPEVVRRGYNNFWMCMLPEHGDCDSLVFEDMTDYKQLNKEILEMDYVAHFYKANEFADVAFKTKDSDNLIHVNKMIMASFSPYFKSLFFTDNPETTEKVDLDIGYYCMLAIVCILYHRRLLLPIKTTLRCWREQLRELYEAAEKYDIPLIKNLVKQQLEIMKPTESFRIAFELGLEAEKIKSLHRMKKSDLTFCLSQIDKDCNISVGEMTIMMAKCGINGFSSDSSSSNIDPSPILTSISGIPELFDHPWGVSDAVLTAKDAPDRPLHINKSVVATFSPVFSELFFGKTEYEAKNSFGVSMEYDILLEILRILHHVDGIFALKRKTYDGKTLKKLYKCSETLEFGQITKFLKGKVVHLNGPEALQLAIQLDLEEREEILKKMSAIDVKIFLEGNKESERKAFSAKEMDIIVKKCCPSKTMF